MEENMLNKNIQNKRLTVTVGVPSCYGNVSILKTLKSIVSSRDAVIDRIIIVADRTPFDPKVREEIEKFNVVFVWNETPGSHPKKVKQMVEMCGTDILIITGDDVVFDEHAVFEIMNAFNESDDVTMVSTKVEPLPAKTLTESVLSGSVRIPFRIVKMWNDGDNYISANGRCISFRTDFIKTFRVFEEMVNSDAYYYFENKRLGGVMRHATKSLVYIRQPETVREQVGPSSRFLISQKELTPYFDYDISQEYRIPKGIAARAILGEFLRHPVNVTMYLFVFIYTRIFHLPVAQAGNPLWKGEASTKDI